MMKLLQKKSSSVYPNLFLLIAKSVVAKNEEEYCADSFKTNDFSQKLSLPLSQMKLQWSCFPTLHFNIFFTKLILLLAQKSFQQKVVAKRKNINENATEREDWFCNNHLKESLKKSFTQSQCYFSNKTKKSSANELQLFEAKQQKQTFLSLTSFLETSSKQYMMTHLNCFC